jgi:hypothetical protein
MRRALLAGTVLVLAVTVMVAQSQDPFTGSWTLNVVKSTMVSPATASKSETVTYTYVGGEEVYVSDAVTAKGEAEHTDYRGVYDGPFGTIRMTVDGKVTSEGPLQLRKLDPRTRLRIAMRKDGTLNGIIVRRLAADGRSITSSILRFDNDGRIVVHETRWFDKKP